MQAGKGPQTRALVMSTVAFTVCFAVWTVFSIIGVQIKQELGLNDTQFGLLVGTPILTGSLIRLVLGIWTDQYGGRLVNVVVMLSAAVATWLLTYATTYETFLLAALGVGIAGGSFAVGVAYVSKWFESAKQGTALGIFGAGNVGAAVTKFVAPFVMVAYGWQTVAQVWATAIAVMAVLFWLFTDDDPSLRERRATGAKPLSFLQQMEPLRHLQVWRFSLYYFFVFGAFVALSLWLPRYLTGAYGMDIKHAGMIAATYSIPASLFRIFGGWLSDRYGARRVMYWTFGVSVICTLLLAYPPASFTIRGIHGPVEFSMETGIGLFIVLIFVLGFFMSLGKAAVFKHIPVYYPNHVGAVGGVVGMIGGLGGFLLPITFGMLNDLTGVWQSCFMLLFVIVGVSTVWMHFAILRMEHRALPQLDALSQDLPELVQPSPLTLTEWEPEDKAFWEAKGRRIATRNLWISIPNLLLAFAVWMVWSVVVVNLPNLGFKYTANQLFWLAALPALSGATLRIFYSFMVPIFGGRRWTTLSTISLLVPCVWIGFAVQNPDTPYLVMLILALLCGFGGGNFSSSMANISFFFPKAQKGTALGLNAGLGNLGVSAVQFVVPLVITASVFGSLGGEPLTWAKGDATRQMWLQNAGFVWVPFIIVAALAAWFGMNDIASAKASFAEQAVVFKRKHNWLMCWLYLGTFGSFIGFSAGFPLLTKTQFPDVNPTQYAFLGPLVGALVRPLGGWLSDRLGGARVTFWNFIAMIAAVFGVLAVLPHGGQGGSFVGFLAMFMVLFVTTGIGNGSTFRMIPVIFLTERQRAAAGQDAAAQEQAVKDANKEAAAVLGFSAAIGAYGGFFIPKSFGSSIELFGGPEGALYGFVVFYLTCIALTWWYYARRNAEMPC
ncbi:NNP family nitrate/nitrite transporter-like MFS transporter [Plasticicumulans lactativorans]|uniref:NNP family nitrate/nitrite transporter-like MFS transporter n=1 Tax=Plasticicumulans lactativorans TaxID=1133106 RepID=A0A4R2L3D3_9GAMM|nr:MFS transporter [Plasticicumulans lactativorans]TCO80883.1 NNP family nitrate/nitrite transporter-like MFS transporter [Plasticicumulans lactativorans]